MMPFFNAILEHNLGIFQLLRSPLSDDGLALHHLEDRLVKENQSPHLWNDLLNRFLSRSLERSVDVLSVNHDLKEANTLTSHVFWENTCYPHHNYHHFRLE